VESCQTYPPLDNSFPFTVTFCNLADYLAFDPLSKGQPYLQIVNIFIKMADFNCFAEIKIYCVDIITLNKLMFPKPTAILLLLFLIH